MSLFAKLFGRKKEKPEEGEAKKAPANGWICESCGKENSNTQQTCPKCGEARYKDG